MVLCCSLHPGFCSDGKADPGVVTGMEHMVRGSVHLVQGCHTNKHEECVLVCHMCKLLLLVC